MIYIYPYKMGSKSAKALREGLSSILGYRVKFVKPDGRFNPRRKDRVINWGCTIYPKWELSYKDTNHPQNIEMAANKLLAFKELKRRGVDHPEWTEDINEARNWFTKKGTTVLCRTKLNGHSGAGIVIADTVDKLVAAPLYVKYKKKRHEYRVHVINGRVVDVQQKKRRNGFRDNEEFTTLIRNIDHGWVYTREGITPDQRLRDIGIAAVKALDLSIGAVDIIYNELEDKYYVLEINTAPGIEGTTITKYVEALAL